MPGFAIEEIRVSRTSTDIQQDPKPGEKGPSMSIGVLLSADSFGDLPMNASVPTGGREYERKKIMVVNKNGPDVHDGNYEMVPVLDSEGKKVFITTEAHFRYNEINGDEPRHRYYHSNTYIQMIMILNGYTRVWTRVM